MTSSYEQIEDGSARAAIDAWVGAFNGRLGDELVGIYIDGSIATGAFNPESSDIDLIVVTRRELAESSIHGLDTAVRRDLRLRGSPWSDEVEITVAPKAALSTFDPEHPTSCWVLERGPTERFKPWQPDLGWLVHLHAMRAHPLMLRGPKPSEFVRDVSAEELRAVAAWGAGRWLGGYLEEPDSLAAPGTRAFAVLTCCRLMYTSKTGEVASKPAAGRWALNHLDAQWHGVIGDALAWHKADARTGPSRDDAIRLMRHTQGALARAQEDRRSSRRHP